jgi:sensor histidine kinase YesM
MLSWRRLRFTLLFAGVVGVLLGLHAHSALVFFRTLFIGLVALTAFGLFEQWPRRLPAWIARWVLQVVGVALAIPIGMTFLAMHAFAIGDKEMTSLSVLFGLAIFLTPWVALAALVRQKDALAHHQALAFDLERSELAREALDARLRLLQAQVAPHFLFNTLANVQALVDAGSPHAAAVLRSLTAYLRAAVPRLNETATTLDEELQLVRAYLELMQMRMPDRLQFDVRVDDAARTLSCPPMTLLTLVENAVRHGIDPSEDGGRIDIRVEKRGDRCLIRVGNTGAELKPSGDGLGTGLSTLRERLRLTFGGEAQLRVFAQEPTGVMAELDLPAREAAA